MIVAWRLTTAWVYVLGLIAGGVLTTTRYNRFISQPRAIPK
jgi:hypothetical protein